MPIDMSQFFQAFFDEAEEHLATMEHLLLGLDLAEPSDDDLNAIFRAAHSIKGSSGTFGFNDMTGVTHELETLLDRLRKRELELTSEMIDAFLEARDVIKLQLDGHRGGGESPVDAAGSVIERLQRLYAMQVTAAPADAGYGFFADEPQAAAPAVARAAVPAEAVADAGYGFFDTVTNAEAAQGYGFFEADPAAAVEDALPTGEGATATQSAQNLPATDGAGAEALRSPRRAGDKPAAAVGEATTIRVGVDKVDSLINLVGELVITQAMLAQNGEGLDPVLHEKLLAGLAQLERNTRDLQESVMSIRMMPMSFV
ncbi:MAG: CheA signal transduction histidine kinase, partial [Betaproteobacteria bacterium]|nr:CheA signal transduction histidine kinase [Betaproteobacteria bacterium]